MPQSSVVLVHGVGPFDAFRTRAAVARALASSDIKKIDNPSTFDWSAIVGDPFGHLHWVGRAFLLLPHLKHGKATPPAIGFLFHTCTLISQITSLAFLPLVVIAVITSPFVHVHWIELIGWTVLIGVLTFTASIAFAGLMGASRRLLCIRQAGMMVLWPIIHSLATPHYLGIWKVLIFAASMLLPLAAYAVVLWTVGVITNSPTGSLVSALKWATTASATLALLAIATLGLFRILAYHLLKYACDVVRWLH